VIVIVVRYVPLSLDRVYSNPLSQTNLAFRLDAGGLSAAIRGDALLAKGRTPASCFPVAEQ
jgi:hypothetical protein